jgi:hypothetical protein
MPFLTFWSSQGRSRSNDSVDGGQGLSDSHRWVGINKKTY